MKRLAIIGGAASAWAVVMLVVLSKLTAGEGPTLPTALFADSFNIFFLVSDVALFLAGFGLVIAVVVGKREANRGCACLRLVQWVLLAYAILASAFIIGITVLSATIIDALVTSAIALTFFVIFAILVVRLRRLCEGVICSGSRRRRGVPAA